MPKSVYSPAYQQFLRMLVDARTSAGITQMELAEKLQWQQTDISKAERGERRLDLVEFLQFAKALGIDTPAFVTKLQKSVR